MSNFNRMAAMIDYYLINNGIDQGIKTDLHEASINDSVKGAPVVYVYNRKNIEVIDMDAIARTGYKKIKNRLYIEDDPINSVDAFLINKDNDWYFIEFKDAAIDKSKDSIIKKAYSNWYMLMDILYEMRGTSYEYPLFDYCNPIKFAQEHVYYIVVCTLEKNPTIYMKIKNQVLLDSTYTLPFMRRLKSYLFKDAYVYTEDFLDRRFVKGFSY